MLASLPLRIDMRSVADLIGVSYAVVRKHVFNQSHSNLLLGLPPPAARGRKLLWVTQDIADWINSQRTFHLAAAAVSEPAPPPRRPRGRPAKNGGGGAA